VGGCDTTTGTAISVTVGSPTSGVDFALELGGTIAGTLTDAATTAPIQYANVFLYDASGNYVGSTETDASGDYVTYAGLPTGTYYALTANYQLYLDELYDDVPCFDFSCDVTTGTPISVTVGLTTGGIDFAIDKGGAISGTVLDASTASPIAGLNVNVYGAGGLWVTYASTDASGGYTTWVGLPTGSYFAATMNSKGFADELYDDLPCPGSSCDVTAGAPISVTAGSTTGGIDFALDLESGTGGSVSGTLTDGSTAAAIPGVDVRIFDSGGSFVTSAITDASGTFTISGLAAGTCYARTMNSAGFLDERFDDLACTASCDILMGTPISVGDGVTTTNIDFALFAEGAAPDLALRYEEISTSKIYEACGSITATDLQILAPATVGLRAGSTVVLGNGFSVGAGAQFSAGTDSSLICP